MNINAVFKKIVWNYFISVCIFLLSAHKSILKSKKKNSYYCAHSLASECSVCLWHDCIPSITLFFLKVDKKVMSAVNTRTPSGGLGLNLHVECDHRDPLGAALRWVSEVREAGEIHKIRQIFFSSSNNNERYAHRWLLALEIARVTWALHDPLMHKFTSINSNYYMTCCTYWIKIQYNFLMMMMMMMMTSSSTLLAVFRKRKCSWSTRSCPMLGNICEFGKDSKLLNIFMFLIFFKNSFIF
jgi:hypothetical protein